MLLFRAILPTRQNQNGVRIYTISKLNSQNTTLGLRRDMDFSILDVFFKNHTAILAIKLECTVSTCIYNDYRKWNDGEQKLALVWQWIYPDSFTCSLSQQIALHSFLFEFGRTRIANEFFHLYPERFHTVPFYILIYNRKPS